MAPRGYYLKDGTQVPSVTTIIGNNLGWGKDGLLGFYRGTALSGRDPENIRDSAAAFGTYVHRCIELDQEWVPVDPEIQSYLSMGDIENGHVAFKLWKQWCERHNVRIKESELPLVSEKLKYGGTLDLVAYVDKKLSLIDIKTTKSIRASHFIQLAAYERLYFESKGKKLDPFILNVMWDRRPMRYDRKRSLSKEWRVFKYLLQLEKLRQEVDV